MKTLLIISSLLIISVFYAIGQEQKPGRQVIEDIVEQIASTSDQDIDLTEIAETLELFFETPMDLNTCTADDLGELVMLNDFQIKNILQYRNKKGQFLSIYELQLIEGLNYPTIKLLLPFITINNNETNNSWNLKNTFKYGKNEVYFRLTSPIEKPVGYTQVTDSVRQEKPNKYYPGSSQRIYTRYKFSYKNNIQMGITAEKDPGEQFFAGEQKYGFDFYSAHLQINQFGIFKSINVGDYQVQLGQGLIMWSYLSDGKSAYAMNIRKKAKGLHKYSSTDENAYLRGAGTTIAYKNLSFTLFGSHKNMDAGIQNNDTLESEEIYFTSLDNTGIHATPNQIAKKDAITESLGGANLSWHHELINLGISGLAYQYNFPLITDSNAFNQFNFTGSQNYNVSSDFQFMFKGLHFFGEAALSKNGGNAILAGALMQLAPQLSASILYRNYSKDYQASYANAFREGSSTQNEKGFYLGVEMHPVKRITITAYYDAFKFPWLKQSVNAPSHGNDFLAQIDYSLSRNVSMYARFKNEIKQQNSDSISEGVNSLVPINKLSARYQINYLASPQWRFKTRVELSYYEKEEQNAEYGYVIYQDVICAPFKFPLNFTFRYAIFETESYNTRIYTYESDVLYAYSVPALYDKGTRSYLMLHYKLYSKLEIWLKYSKTWYANKNSVGSGLNEINGNTKSEIKVQLRWKI